MLVRTLTDKALLITASKVRYKKGKTKSLVKFMFILNAKNKIWKVQKRGTSLKELVSDQE